MRWVKHMSNANKDDKLVSLRAAFGMWGIGVYWNLIEFVAEQVKEKSETAEATLIVSELLGFFGCKRNKLETFLECSQNVGLFSYQLNGNILKIDIPKMLDYADNYIKYEGKSLKTIQRQKEMSSKQDKNRIEEDKNIVRTHPQNALEATEYFLKIGGNSQDSSAWFDHFESNGWKVGGKTPMKDWQASARTWMRNKGAFSKTPIKPDPPMVRKVNKCISCFRPIPDSQTICEECETIKKDGKVVDVSELVNGLTKHFKGE